MATASRALKRFQVGLEATPGTPVPATFKMVGDTDATIEIDREYEDFARQVYAPLTGGGIDLRKGTLLNHSGNLTYEEIAYIFATTIQDPGAPVGEGPYVYTFDRPWNAPPSVKTFTGEWTEDDGSVKHVEREAAHGFGSAFEITIGRNEIARKTWEAIARASVSTTETPSLGALAGRSPISSNLFRLYINDAWEDLGDTQKSGVIRAATLRYTSGITPGYTLDGRASQDFTKLDYSQATATLSLTAEVNADAAAELAKFEARALRFVRLAATDGTKAVEIDMSAIHRSAPTISDDEGVRVATFELHMEYDPTSAKAFEAVVTNQLESL